MRSFTADNVDSYTPQELASYLVNYEFSDPAARFKSHQELIAYYADLLEKREQSITLQAKADENDYHWHHQKHIEKLAHDGSVSGYFLDRRDQFTAQRAKLHS